MREMTKRSPWIVNRRYDLTWFIGAALLGYLFLYAHIGLGISGLTLWWVWALTVDSPHLFATYWITYLHPDFRRQNQKLLYGSLVLLIAPMTLLPLGGWLGSALPLKVFLSFALLYGWWHIARQHYGFVVLYQVQAQEDQVGYSNRWDYWFLHCFLGLSAFAFILRNPALGEFVVGEFSPLMNTLSLTLLYHLCVILACGSVAFYVGHGFVMGKENINWPKLIYISMIVPFYALVFLVPSVVDRIEFRAIPPLITVFHSVQYHALVWKVGQKRFDDQEAGLGTLLKTAFLPYFCAGLLFTWIYQGGTHGIVHFAKDHLDKIVGPLTNGLHDSSDFIFVFLFSVAIHHYYIDQRIWKRKASARSKS